jgi:LPS sulfotransferase NodH
MRYAILSTPRTGSNALCDLLAQTGIAGMKNVHDASFFIGYGIGVVDGYANAVEAYFERNQTENGIEGCKIEYDYLEHLSMHLPPGSIGHIMKRFDCFIVLRRQDVIAQAVSRLIAQQTGQWTSEDSRGGEPVYDCAAITYHIAHIRAGEAFFREMLLGLGHTNHLLLYYEHNIRDWQIAVNRVLRHIGVGMRDMQLEHHLQKQVDPCKEAFIARYQAERVSNS